MNAVHKRSASDFVVVGRLGTAHGIKGWLKVTSFTEPRDGLFDYSPWYLQQDGHWVEREVRSTKVQGKGLVVHLAQVNDRDQALALRGTDIAIVRSQLPTLDADEYYWTDLVGLKVVTTNDVELGHITEMMATGANDVMVVEQEEQRRLVPFVQGQVVMHIDLESALMRVDWDPEF